jgi:hypothetical protein
MFIPDQDPGYVSHIQIPDPQHCVQFEDVCCVRLAEEVCVDGHETTLLSLKSYPPGFLKKMVLELGAQLDTIHAVQVGITYFYLFQTLL